jgi:hypothetical protein
MREQKDRLSVKLSKISKEENLEYFRKWRAESKVKPMGQKQHFLYRNSATLRG